MIDQDSLRVKAGAGAAVSGKGKALRERASCSVPCQVTCNLRPLNLRSALQDSPWFSEPFVAGRTGTAQGSGSRPPLQGRSLGLEPRPTRAARPDSDGRPKPNGQRRGFWWVQSEFGTVRPWRGKALSASLLRHRWLLISSVPWFALMAVPSSRPAARMRRRAQARSRPARQGRP